MSNIRVPVVYKKIPLMPMKSSRVRKFINSGKAKPKRDKLGNFYIELIEFPENGELNTQEIVVGIDPGSSFTGIAIVSKERVHIGLNLYLPTYLKDKLISRGILRRQRKRRHRIKHSKSTVNNGKLLKVRNAKKFNQRSWRIKFGAPSSMNNKIKPSILQRKQLEKSVVEKLSKIYPISNIVYEHTKLNHYKYRNTNSFPVIEQGVSWLLDKLFTITKNIQTVAGYETKIMREQLKLEKLSMKDKGKENPKAHVNDAIAIANLNLKTNIILNEFNFTLVKRPDHSDRKYRLHKATMYKGGRKYSWGGTVTEYNNCRKGDFVKYKNNIYYNAGQYIKTFDNSIGRYSHKSTLINRSCNIVVKAS